MTPADHANTIRSAPRQLDSSTAAWVRLCSKTVALAAAWAEFKLALDDYGLVCHGALWVCDECERIGSQADARAHRTTSGHPIRELDEETSTLIREEWLATGDARGGAR